MRNTLQTENIIEKVLFTPLLKGIIVAIIFTLIIKISLFPVVIITIATILLCSLSGAKKIKAQGVRCKIKLIIKAILPQYAKNTTSHGSLIRYTNQSVGFIGLGRSCEIETSAGDIFLIEGHLHEFCIHQSVTLITEKGMQNQINLMDKDYAVIP